MEAITCTLKTYIQPFERRLSLMELERVAKAPPEPVESDNDDEPHLYQVATDLSPFDLAGRLTYWDTVRSPSAGTIVTTQVLREGTPALVRNGVTPPEIRVAASAPEAIPLPNRRVLRYGSHGLHEYRGKFFPQLVRALLNISGVGERGVVLDPMCGSGTTLVEGSLVGASTFGADLNPLSALLSRTKTAVLSVHPDELAREYETLKRDLLSREPPRTMPSWLKSLSTDDQRYLSLWFSPQILADLDPIASRINDLPKGPIHDLFMVCLSNILRRVSWQKTDDLRVRKEVVPDADVDVAAEFIQDLSRTVRTILAFLYREAPLALGKVVVKEADARRASTVFRKLLGTVDAVVTSPPYATALPYLDTDRLSLCYLGLLPRGQQRDRDFEMIGNREVTEAQRQRCWKDFESQRSKLPESVSELVMAIKARNDDADVGFRRRNLPALLGRYFLDMREVLAGIERLLRPGGDAYVVIGNNHTIAGGTRVEIETDMLLAQIGEAVGLEVRQIIPMEMLTSRDIFKRNAVASETILCLSKH